MTREEIMSMGPGRMLDSEIALRIFKAKEITVIGDYYWIDESIKKQVPYYSTDIAAAWEVVKRYLIEIIPQAGAPSGYHYLACITDRLKHDDDIEVFGDTAPEAICKAALLAVTEG